MSFLTSEAPVKFSMRSTRYKHSKQRWLDKGTWKHAKPHWITNWTRRTYEVRFYHKHRPRRTQPGGQCVELSEWASMKRCIQDKDGLRVKNCVLWKFDDVFKQCYQQPARHYKELLRNESLVRWNGVKSPASKGTLTHLSNAGTSKSVTVCVEDEKRLHGGLSGWRDKGGKTEAAQWRGPGKVGT